MMRLKTKTNFLDLQPGFWNENVFEKLTRNEQLVLSKEVWTFSRVHRICSYIRGLENPVPACPSTLLPEPWPKDKIMPLISGVYKQLSGSDWTKRKWGDSQAAKSDSATNLDKPKSDENSRLSKIRASATKHEKRLMSGIIESEKIKTTFEDVHAPAETIDALQTLTMLSLARPDAFSYGVLASDKIPGLLLYGPPGTGKTLLAKAVAKESGATMLEVSAADINDMFVGEGEKNVKALFSLAKKLSPCVVFLDEADAMFSARSNSGRRVSHRELLNQFLKEWDGMSNDSGSAFIMVATNRPMDLDDAVLRRLPRRLLVDLPTEADRLEILKIHLRNEQLADDVHLPDFAMRTPFYSGSDLKNLAVAAALNAVREEEKLAKTHQGEEPYQYPVKRILTKEHFETAMEEISASINEDMTSLREIKKFDEQYGDKRGRKNKAPKWGFKSAKEADRVLDTVKVRN
jgi:SpoVK/Ycf46/Vps4 family AAA+-type ATPase